MYARHARDLRLENVTFDFAGQELRPALVCDDVQDLELSNFRAVGNAEGELVRLVDTCGAFIHDCRPLGKVARFLDIQGNASEGILVQSNDLRGSGNPYSASAGADNSTVILQ